MKHADFVLISISLFGIWGVANAIWVILLSVIFTRGVFFFLQCYTKGAFSSCDGVYLGWPNVYTEGLHPARGISLMLCILYIRHTV